MTPRNVEQNQQIRDERREQILHAALEIFARKGPGASRVSDIANLAGLSHGLVYHYFRSKDEIFTELAKIALESAEASFRFALQTPFPPLERLRMLTEGILTHAYQGDGPYYFYLMIMVYFLETIPEELKEHLSEYQPVHLEYLVDTLKEGQASGEIVEGDPMRLATLYISIIYGLAIFRMDKGVAPPLPDTEMVMRMFKKNGGSTIEEVSGE